jgi:hypothetical protein
VRVVAPSAVLTGTAPATDRKIGRHRAFRLHAGHPEPIPHRGFSKLLLEASVGRSTASQATATTKETGIVVLRFGWWKRAWLGLGQTNERSSSLPSSQFLGLASNIANAGLCQHKGLLTVGIEEMHTGRVDRQMERLARLQILASRIHLTGHGFAANSRVNDYLSA